MIVSALTSEPATATAQAWLWTQRPSDIAISDWTATEFSAALSVKVRVRRREDCATALAEFARLTARYF